MIIFVKQLLYEVTAFTYSICIIVYMKRAWCDTSGVLLYLQPQTPNTHIGQRKADG